jgi:predicted nucleotidyltransferase
MTYQMLSQADRLKIVELLSPICPSFIYLFGSAQRDELRPESDVDIAFYHPQDVDFFVYLSVKESIASALSRDVDLVALKDANDVLRAQVIGYGELLSAREPQVLYERQMRWLKQYAMLNQERAPILERIKREGRIYG